VGHCRYAKAEAIRLIACYEGTGKVGEIALNSGVIDGSE
jgi:hypothetical protein